MEMVLFCNSLLTFFVLYVKMANLNSKIHVHLVMVKKRLNLTYFEYKYYYYYATNYAVEYSRPRIYMHNL